MEKVGFGRRFIAEFLDGLIIGGGMYIIISLLFDLNDNDAESISSLFYAFYATLLPVWWHGYIVGKKIMKIHVSRIDGERITLWTMIKREIIGKQLLVIVTLGLSVIVSAFMVGLSENKRAIHDYIAGTHVVKDHFRLL